MKRASSDADDYDAPNKNPSSASPAPRMKRRASSMFSIATVNEDDDDNEEPSAAISKTLLQVGQQNTLLPPLPKGISSAATVSTTATTEEDEEHITSIIKRRCEEGLNSEEDEDEGLFIEEEDEDISDHNILAVGNLFRHAFPRQVGIVVEAGTSHFDRSNRLHKERPARVESVVAALQKEGLLAADDGEGEGEDNDNRRASCTRIVSSGNSNFCLNESDFLRVHLPGYLKLLDKWTSQQQHNNNNCACATTPISDERLDREAAQFKSIFLTSDSGGAAKQAASALCELVAQCLSSESNFVHGFAVIRPPGHHAEPGVAGGYCLVNNVAVAAAYARQEFPQQVRKVLIVDWDVHHGQGSQAIFYDDPNVMYFSVHRLNFFPFRKESGPEFVGEGAGEGFNVNVGWSRKGMGDAEYYAVWQTLLLPMAVEFDPDLVLISAGFDAAAGDLGECHVTPECFGNLTRQLHSALSYHKKSNNKLTINDDAVVPIVCALEGGYVRSVLGKCVTAVVQALLDNDNGYDDDLDHCFQPQDNSKNNAHSDILEHIDHTAAKNIRQTAAAHRTFWKCLRYLD